MGRPPGRYEFCAYADAAFLPRLLALYESLARFCPGFRLWLLCLDAETERVLARLGLASLRPVPLAELEAADPEAAALKKSRAPLDYYITLTPVFPRYVWSREPSLTHLTYLDADLMFFGDPGALFDELGDGSVAVTEHRYAARHRGSAALYGRFNDGWVTFRNTPAARACLDWWRERCLEWCFGRVEDGKFTEQKYLDEWPSRFEGVRVLGHPGVNVAYWNMEESRFEPAGDGCRVNGAPLLFFHYSGFRTLVPGVYELLRHGQEFVPPPLVREVVYRPYVRAVEEARRRLWAAGWTAPAAVTGREMEAVEGLRRAVRAATGLLSGRCLFSARDWLDRLT